MVLCKPSDLKGARDLFQGKLHQLHCMLQEFTGCAAVVQSSVNVLLRLLGPCCLRAISAANHTRAAAVSCLRLTHFVMPAVSVRRELSRLLAYSVRYQSETRNKSHYCNNSALMTGVVLSS